MRNHRLLQPFIVAITLMLLAGLTALIKRPASAPVSTTKAISAFGQAPLSFEARDDAQFIARGPGYSIGLKANEAWLHLSVPRFSVEPASNGKTRERKILSPNDPNRSDVFWSRLLAQSSLHNHQSSVLRMKLAGADPASKAEALETLPGKVNYFIGADPQAWREGAPTYAKVRYQEVYPGIDLVYYGNQRRLEYDFIVAPGTDPDVIELRFEGADALRIDDNGDLVLNAGAGELRQRKPVIYQEVNGERRKIDGSYEIRNPQSAIYDQTVGFHLGNYDASLPLVIDPVMAYSTYFGSGGGEDVPGAVAVDANGQVYVVGTTGSGDFPTANPAQGNLRGRADIFVSKLNAAGNALVYSTYLGGANEGQGGDIGFGIAVDGAGAAYVTGVTSSSDFPRVAAFQSTLSGPTDAFVTKLNANGGIVFSTYLGGNSADLGFGIAVDTLNTPYIVGTTSSTDLLSGTRRFTDDGAEAGAAASPEQAGLRGPSDAFVIKLAPTGSARIYGRYLGGGGAELGLAITVDLPGAAYVTGLTASNDFPTANPLQSNSGGGETDGFVTKIAVNGGSLEYSTYLGGSGLENHTFLQQLPFPGAAIAVDNAGNAYVASVTTSSNFPTRNPAQGTFGGVADAYVAKLNAAGNALVYSTFIGGSGEDTGFGVAVDATGAAHVAGATSSTDFPLENALQSSLKGQTDAFVTKLNAAGTAFAYSTYLGGGSVDLAVGVAVDPAGAAYVFGLTASTDYPTAQPMQSSLRGEADTFIAKLRDESGGGPTVGVLASVSAANYLGPQLAPESIVAAFGGGLATRVEAATSLPLPTTLAGTTVVISTPRTPRGGISAPLFFVAPTQINFQMPPGITDGEATITVTSGSGQVSRGVAQITLTAPGLFSADASGQGLTAAVILRIRPTGEQVFEPVAQFDQSLNRFVAVPIDLGPASDQVFLILFGTGMRYRTVATASIGGTDSPVLYVGPSVFVGLDQCNVSLPRSLAGRGEVNVVMTVDGRAANTVRASFR
jgi:uncharacterized protein (TIGR03437 family)